MDERENNRLLVINPVNEFNEKISKYSDRKGEKSLLAEILDSNQANLTTFLIIISSIGSAVQIYELTRIDLSYIRFFSVTQLISDGALVAVTILLSLLCYIFFDKIVISTETVAENISKKKDYFIERMLSGKGLDVVSFFYFSIPIFVFFAQYELNRSYLESSLLLLIFITSTMFLLLKMTFIYTYIYYEYLKASPNNFKFKKVSLVIAKWIRPTILIMAVYLFVSLLIAYMDVYKIPYNLENYKKVNIQIEQDHENLKSHRILYFNDEYMFIELIRKDERTIAMYETKSILFD